MDCEADCPICLCPILSLSSSSSLPWGVSVPCGHAYHRECWDNVVASHRGRSTSSSRNHHNKNTPCAICKGNTTGFVPVFIELGSGCGGGCVGGDSGSNPSEKDDIMVSGVIDIDENNGIMDDNIMEEWDELWNQLEELCGYNDDDEREMTTASSSSSGLERRGDREIERICVAIDLTQSSSPPPKYCDDAKQRGKNRAKKEEQMELEERRRKVTSEKIHCILTRLKSIHHHNIRNMPSCQTMLGGANRHQQQRHIERLRSRIAKLQSDNTELHRTTCKLQESNTSLSNKLAESEQISSDFTVEMERSKLKYESLHKQHQQSQNENARLLAQYNNEKSTLTNTILKLRQQNKELMEDVSLENIQELEEVRTRYSKMAQALHDAKMERNKAVLELTRKVQELEGRLEMEKINGRDTLKCAKDEEPSCPMLYCAGRSPSKSCSDETAVSTKKLALSKHRIGGSLGKDSARSGAVQQPSCGSSNRAMDVLNATSSRKFPRHLDHLPPRRRYNHHRDAVASLSSNEEHGDEHVMDNGVQLLMRTGDIVRYRSSKKRRSDDTRSGNHTTSFCAIDESTSVDGNTNCHGKEDSQSSNCSSLSSNIIALKELATSTESSLQRRTRAVVAFYSPLTKRRGDIKSYFKKPV